MNSRKNLIIPSFEIDDKGNVLCKSHSEYDVLERYAKLNNPYRHKVLTCNLCNHYLRDDCYFSKETLEEIKTSITYGKYRCSLCNSRIKLMFNILYQKFYEDHFTVHVSQICCYCYSILHSKNPKRSSFKFAVWVNIPVVLYLSFLYFNTIAVEWYPAMTIFTTYATIVLLIPTLFLFMKGIKRRKALKKMNIEKMSDYFTNLKKNNKSIQQEDLNHQASYESDSNHSDFQISEWTLDKLDQRIEISNGPKESKGIKIKRLFGYNKFTIRLDPEIGKARNLTVGDVIELLNPQTNKHVYRIIEKSKNSDKGTRSIRLTKFARELLNAELKDKILIKKANYGYAKKLFLAGLEKITASELKLRTYDKIVLGIGDQFYVAGDVSFKVVDYFPQYEAVLLNENTKINVLNGKYADIIDKNKKKRV